MSHEATNWAFKQRGLKPAARVVLLYLADRHNPDFGCFPSQAQLAHDCELSRRSVNDQLDELERIGLIRRQRRVNPETRKQMSTRYILGFEAAFAQEPCANSAHGDDAEPCANSDESRVQNLHTNPVREPVITTPPPTADRALGDECVAACGPGLSERARSLIRETDPVIRGWLEAGADLRLDVLPVLTERTSKRRPMIRTWDYFTEAVRSRKARRLAQAAGVARSAGKQESACRAPEAERLASLADWINSGGHVPPSAVNNVQRDELLASGLVKPERLRELQIY